MTALQLPLYETSGAVLHEHLKNVAITVACHTSKWPCKLQLSLLLIFDSSLP